MSTIDSTKPGAFISLTKAAEMLSISVPTLDPALARDPMQPQIARRLYELERGGFAVRRLLDAALAQGPRSPTTTQRPLSGGVWQDS